MIIESGIIIFIGFLFLLMKLPRRVLLRMLDYPLTVDLVAAILAYILHWGTFTGVMAAAVAGLLMSALTTISRSIIGYIGPDEEGHMTYFTGRWDILPDLPYSE